MKLSFTCFCLMIMVTLHAQDFVWEKDHPGIIRPIPTCPVKNFRANTLFEILHRIPFIAKPIGFDVAHGISVSLEGKVYQGELLIGFPKYFRYQKGPVQQQEVFCSEAFIINDPWSLMNKNSILFSNETGQLGLPTMFTDTFEIEEKDMNGYPVGYTTSSFANRGTRMFVLNPRHRPVFLPVTREQYLQLWIGKLKKEVADGWKKDAEFTESIKQFSENPKMKSGVPELEKIQKASQALLRFLDEKRKTYEQRLKALTAEEKKAPAYYSLPTDVANWKDKNGNYKEVITGHMPYEPDEGADAVEVKPLFRFNPEFFDRSLPNTAFQLIALLDCYSEEDHNELKTFLDQEFYPKINFRDIAALMYK
jgi:hypothetical protein